MLGSFVFEETLELEQADRANKAHPRSVGSFFMEMM
jgi:hypothetical protein